MISMNNPRKIRVLFFVLLFILQAGLHAPVFFKDLTGFHVWRQTQTQNTIESFAEEDFNILNPRKNERGDGEGIFRMEFPLMQWLTAIPIQFSEQKVLLSRMMTFLFMFFGLIGFYQWIFLMTKRFWVATVGVFILSFSPVIYYYMVNPMPDILALSLGIWGICFLTRWHMHHHDHFRVAALIFFSLAALVKLPYVLYFGAYGYLVIFSPNASLKEKVRGLIAGILSSTPVLAWYIWVIPDWEGNGIVQGVFQMTPEQQNQYGYYVWYHLRTTLPELLLGWPLVPAFLIGLFVAIKKIRKNRTTYLYLMVPFILLVMLLLFEMNMIETVHDYYFMPLLPFIYLIAIAGLNYLMANLTDKKWMKIAVMFLLVASPFYTKLRIDGRWERTGFNPDWMVYKEELRSAVPDSALVCVGNDVSHHIFLYYVDKKGWVFENNWITADKLSEMIQKGCLFLYSDSRVVDEHPDIASYFGTKVAEFGSVRVFRLEN